MTKESRISKIIWWSFIPSCVIAFFWAGDLIFNRSQRDGMLLFGIIAYPFAFGIFLALVWTPIIGITILACTLFQVQKPYYSWRIWILFAVLLVPFYGSLRILLTSATMVEYRQFFHLHQLYVSPHRLTEEQAVSIANKVVTDHNRHLEDFKEPVVFLVSDSSEWNVRFFSKPVYAAKKPRIPPIVLVMVADKTGDAKYVEGW